MFFLMLDIGQDGTGLEVNARFARDAAALMLQYYQNDYRPIAGNNYYNLTANSATDLYNGNISCLSTDYYTETPLLKSFRYDKLNRIKRMQTAGVSAGEWGSLTDNFSTEYRYDYNGNILSLQRKDATAQVMHHINYTYNAKNNRLQAITATGINSSTYSYDAIGNLSNDSGENINVTWNAMNKVKTVVTPNSTLHFAYSPIGQRQIKKTGDKTEYYLHDATGNIMCVYELSGNYLTVKERMIYGSKRIGVYRQRIQLTAFTGFGQAILLPGSGLVNVLHPSPIISPDGRQYLEGSNRLQVIGVVRTTLSVNTLAYKKGTIELKGLSPLMAVRPTFLDGAKTAGLRDYELTDHLSNVMAVISDRKLSVDTNSDTITDYYEPQVVSFTDYYPFGFPMAERSENLSGYRFGFNGQESDGEVYGTKQSYTAEFWQYDTRLGRRWNVDVVRKPYLSVYSTYRNNPTVYVDPKGSDDIFTIKKTGKVTIIKTRDNFDRQFIDGIQQGENLEQGWGMKTYANNARIIDIGNDWNKNYLYDCGRIIGLSAYKSYASWMPEGKEDNVTPATTFYFGIVDLGGGFENSFFYQTFYSDYNPKSLSGDGFFQFNPPGYYLDGNSIGIYPDERMNNMSKNTTGIPFDLFMFDEPTRAPWSPENMIWSGNTSFLYKTTSGEIKILITIEWGFTVTNFTVNRKSVKKTDTPSIFHIQNVPNDVNIEIDRK